MQGTGRPTVPGHKDKPDISQVASTADSLPAGANTPVPAGGPPARNLVATPLQVPPKTPKTPGPKGPPNTVASVSQPSPNSGTGLLECAFPPIGVRLLGAACHQRATECEEEPLDFVGRFQAGSCRRA